MTEPTPEVPTPEEAELKAELGIRGQLLQTLHSSPAAPDLAATLYESMGMDATDVRLHGVQSPIHELKPGDLVGWNGGHKPDGSYVGNLAIYAGDNEILEKFYGHQRRRKLNYDEDVFGMPVYLRGD